MVLRCAVYLVLPLLVPCYMILEELSKLREKIKLINTVFFSQLRYISLDRLATDQQGEDEI